MASIVSHKGKWRAMVSVAGTRKTKVFELKTDAKRWAAALEEEIRTGRYIAGQHTLHAAFKDYRDKVSPTKRGARWEEVRLNKFLETIEDAPLDPRLTPKLTEFRDKRLTEVSPASVRRELNLIASVLEQARREWKWCAENYARDVKKPPSPPARRRGVRQDEIDAVVEALGYRDDFDVTLKQQEVAVAFLLGIETAMRASEILTAQYDLERRVAILDRTKNGDRREVPLSLRAAFLKSKVPVWTVTSASLDALFRRAREKAGVTGLHFHDGRAEAITRLSKKLDVTQLARMIGHRDLKSLMIYYAESAEDIAKRLG